MADVRDLIKWAAQSLYCKGLEMKIVQQNFSELQ